MKNILAEIISSKCEEFFIHWWIRKKNTHEDLAFYEFWNEFMVKLEHKAQ